ncbi:MAG TPA: tetratricopeptide repeat protein [Candidatus Polarisedimenticolia bacterium]|nr:tetratricopeptide repeat protein [Candidatus Polarisedimenticolia bacterium]
MRPKRAVLLLAAVCLLANSGALRPGFIHDDHRIIEQNDLTADLQHLPQIFSSGYWSTADERVTNLYRPLTILSFALDRALHGLRPLGFRLVNLLLHVLTTVLVYSLAGRVLAEAGRRAALGAALLFAVHPVHAEVLGEIVGRSELLAAAFGLASVLAFLRARAAEEHGSAPRPLYALSLASFALAFLAKENAAVVPGLIVLADLLVVRRRPAWAYHLTAAAALALVLALRLTALGGLNPSGPVHFVDNPIATLSFVDGRLTALLVLARYASLLVWPRHLAIDYSYAAIPAATGPLDPGVVAGGLLLAGWGLGVALSWRRAPAVAFALAWIGVALAPVANLLFPIGTIMAERLLYFPSVGFCLLAALALERATASPAFGRARPSIGTVVMALVVLALAARSVVRLRDWRDDYTIFKAALRVEPDSVRSLFNYASACEERGDDSPAIESYDKAIRLWPGYADAHYNLAGVLSRQKRTQESVDHYREALRLRPGDVRYMVNLAHGLIGIDRAAEARDLLRRAITIDPKSDRAFTTLGMAELALGDPPAALTAYREAVRLQPENADYLRNLGMAQNRNHDPGAVDSLRRALQIRPGDPDLMDGLGLMLLDAGDAPGAREPLERAVAARPSHPVYRYHLARALEQTGNLQEAATQYREAIRMAPSVPVAHKALGLLLHRLGDREGAVSALERAAELDPNGTVMDDSARALLASLRRGGAGAARR